MGVRHNVYTMIGIEYTDKDTINFLRDVVDENEAYFQRNDCGFTVVFEPMDMSFAVVGVMLTCINDYGETEMGDLGYPISSLEHIAKTVEREVNRVIPALEVEWHRFDLLTFAVHR